jgi:hypothetical protein
MLVVPVTFAIDPKGVIPLPFAELYAYPPPITFAILPPVIFIFVVPITLLSGAVSFPVPV